ncbi:MAG: PilZ domain-containing protein [Acidobacteriota bacterium]|nr:PilZ domain-containing protein [Acidobacteriota bacterium]
MSIEKRRHIRFSLDIAAIRYTRHGEAVTTVLNQISIGGCLAEWDENVYVGDEFRVLVQLPNKNFLPLKCKALYRFADNGIGTKFLDITQFEQELLSRIISHNLEKQGLSLQVDPFAHPKNFNKNKLPTLTDSRRHTDEILEEILSIEI